MKSTSYGGVALQAQKGLVSKALALLVDVHLLLFQNDARKSELPIRPVNILGIVDLLSL